MSCLVVICRICVHYVLQQSENLFVQMISRVVLLQCNIATIYSHFNMHLHVPMSTTGQHIPGFIIYSQLLRHDTYIPTQKTRINLHFPTYLYIPYNSFYTVYSPIAMHTVQIAFIFIGQTRLVFGKCVCTCVTKHSNAFRTFLNWLKNSKRVWHEPKLHISRLPLFTNFDLWSVSVWWV